MNEERQTEPPTSFTHRVVDQPARNLVEAMLRRKGITLGSVGMVAVSLLGGPRLVETLQHVEGVPAKVATLETNQAANEKVMERVGANVASLGERLQRDEEWLKAISQKNAELREKISDLGAEIKIVRAGLAYRSGAANEK